MLEWTLCAACEVGLGTVLILTRSGDEVAICPRCWLTIRDDDRTRSRDEVGSRS
jgi:hypothetical protein